MALSGLAFLVLSHPLNMLGLMCILCDGASRDELLFSLHAAIEERGWIVQPVAGGEGNPPWAYSIGLSNRFDHPEMVMVGGELRASCLLLLAIGDQIAEGAVILPGMTVATTDDYRFRVATVHPSHFSIGTLALWAEYYSALCRPLPPAHAIEIVWPDEEPHLERRQSLFFNPRRDRL
jgi:hypothetical protein